MKVKFYSWLERSMYFTAHYSILFHEMCVCVLIEGERESKSVDYELRPLEIS